MKALKDRITSIATLGAAALPTSAFALTANTGNWSPTSTGFEALGGQFISMMNGPIGFVAGAVCLLAAVVSAVRAQLFLAVPAILGAVTIFKLDTILSGLGATI